MTENTNEIEILKKIDDILSKIEDQSIKDRIISWIIDKYYSKSKYLEEVNLTNPKNRVKNRGTKIKTKRSSRGNKSYNPKPNIVDDIDFTPTGKQSFIEFISEKKPTTMKEKCTIAVYYLSNFSGVIKISMDHIFTSFKIAKWRAPSNLYDTLAHISSENNWLDTKDMNNIKINTVGTNMVEFDLPKSVSK